MRAGPQSTSVDTRLKPPKGHTNGSGGSALPAAGAYEIAAPDDVVKPGLAAPERPSQERREPLDGDDDRALGSPPANGTVRPAGEDATDDRPGAGGRRAEPKQRRPKAEHTESVPREAHEAERRAAELAPV